MLCLFERRAALLCFALLWKSKVILVKLPAISWASLRFARKSQLCNCPKRNPEKWNSFSRRWWMGCWNVEDQHPKQTSSPSGRWKKHRILHTALQRHSRMNGMKAINNCSSWEFIYKVAADLSSVISTKFYRTRTRLKTALVVKMLTKLCEKLGIDDI